MEKGVLILGGVLAAGVVLVLFTKSKQQATAQNYALAQQAAYQSSTAGQVGSALSSVGGFLNSGALGNLFSAFSPSSPGTNDPGLNDPNPSAGLNDPGLLDPLVDESSDYYVG